MRHFIFRGTGQVVYLSIALMFAAISGYGQSFTAHVEAYPVFRSMQEELVPFSWDMDPAQPVIRNMYSACVRGIDDASHVVGTIDSTDYTVAVHRFMRTDVPPERTIVVLHGYLAQARQLSALVRHLLERNTLVLIPELPGHGLSSGLRGHIDDFSQYGTLVRDVLDEVMPHVPRPIHVIGHSTGASAIMEYLHSYPDVFEGVVFAAPLVRVYLHGLARFGRFVTQAFMEDIQSAYDGPLEVERMPFTWFDAADEFADRLEGYQSLTRPILVLQGTADRVVAWRRNLKSVRRMFPNATIDVIDGASHTVIQSAGPFREEAFRRIDDYLAIPEPLDETAAR